MTATPDKPQGSGASADADRAGRATEAWRAVPGFEGLYEVSSLGHARSLHFDPPRPVAPFTDKDGYPVIACWRKGARRAFALHRLVCRVFNGEQPNTLHNEAAHLDGDRANCCASNLKWVSRTENHSHQRLHGTHPQGEKHGSSVLTDTQAAAIKGTPRSVGLRKLAAQYGVGWRTIADVRYGRRYAHV